MKVIWTSLLHYGLLLQFTLLYKGIFKSTPVLQEYILSAVSHDQ